MRRRSAAVAGVLMALLQAAVHAEIAVDPLPSWNDGATKRSIVDFVARVTTEGSADFVPPAERIAVFDNDGTLWCEQPIYIQFAFAIDRVKALAPEHPEWKEREPFKSVLAGDLKAALAGGEKGVAELLAATHAGMTTDEFNAIVKQWIATAKHPTYGRTYDACVYQPMLEVLAYLRANDFKTFIVSGGGVEFMRAFAEEAYGIPPEQVVGSAGVTKLEVRDEKPVLVKEAKVLHVDDGPGKPVGINLFIGRRPIMAFGNSDGDKEMLEYTMAGEGPRFAMIIHHTDGVREVAYDRTSQIGRLDKALDEATRRDWAVVEIAKDWREVFPQEQ